MTESRWFKEGQEARKRGDLQDSCPYALRSPKWYIWNEGFSS